MTRDLCIEYPDAFYHIYSRGINRQELYYDNEDCKTFLSICRKAVEKFNLRVFAFCLMNNHYHLYLSTPDANIAKSIKFINETYARYFIKKYPEKDGHVFRGRYGRKIVQDEQYSFTLLAYIHHNPKKAKLVHNLEQWQWSSYASYLHYDLRFDFIDYDWILNKFGSKKEEQLINFIKFHYEGYDPEWDPSKETRAGIFMGDDAFIKNICDNYIDLTKLQPSDVKGVGEMMTICNSQSLMFHIKKLRIEDKLKDKLLAFTLMEYTGYSLKDIGKKIDKSPKAVSKLVQRFRNLMKDDLGLNNMVVDLIKMSNVELRP